MKNINDSDELERYKRAILVIEGLTFTEGTTFEELSQLLGEIYTVAHRVSKHCKGPVCQDLSIVERHEQGLKDSGIIDVEKAIEKCH